MTGNDWAALVLGIACVALIWVALGWLDKGEK